MEIAFGLFTSVSAGRAAIGNFGVLPFLLLFIVGYFYTGFSSLFHNLLKFPFVDMVSPAAGVDRLILLPLVS